MPVYEYKALDESGSPVSGILDADSPKTARQKLRAQKLFVTSIEESREEISITDEVKLKRVFRRTRLKDVATTTRQLATLIRSGLPLFQALTAIIEQLQGHPMQRVMYLIREKVNAGSTFGDALQEHPKQFNELYVNLVRAGESSGALEMVLARLADHLEATQRQRSKVISALVYPSLMVFVGASVLSFLMVYVVPKLTNIFEKMERSLPKPTLVLKQISAFVGSYKMLIVVGAAIAAIVAIRFYIRTKKGRLIYDSVKLRIPIIGGLVRKICIARLARTLSTLLSGGIPLVRSLEIARGVVGNEILAAVVEKSRTSISEGRPISEEFRRSKQYPPIVVHMISVGELSGNLEEMLSNVAEAYENEVETATTGLISLLEPLLIIIMGVIVGFIVLSILLPIFEMNNFAR
jgi:general secretion pathway protein F